MLIKTPVVEQIQIQRHKREINPQATEFRPKRNAAAIAELKISDKIQEESEPPQVE